MLGNFGRMAVLSQENFSLTKVLLIFEKDFILTLTLNSNFRISNSMLESCLHCIAGSIFQKVK